MVAWGPIQKFPLKQHSIQIGRNWLTFFFFFYFERKFEVIYNISASQLQATTLHTISNFVPKKSNFLSSVWILGITNNIFQKTFNSSIQSGNDWIGFHLFKDDTRPTRYISRPGPVFCLLLTVGSGCAWPITGQVTSVTCHVIGWA